MNKKVILSSILTLILCASFIVGGTFALFTSESKTNISVTSGKVDVVATIENLSLYSPELIETDGSYDENVNAASIAADGMSGVFVNGGTANLNGAVLTLDKITPGDMVTFQIKITNNSNVKTQYRTVIKIVDDNGLAAGLDMIIDGVAYDGNSQYTNWAPLEVVEEVDVLDCSVALPTMGENQNQYQGKSCKLVYIVEAVQSNASTTNNVAEYEGTGYATLEAALEAAEAVNNGGTVKITRPGTYASFTITKPGITVEGIVAADKSESTVIKTTATENIKIYADNVTLNNLYIDGAAYNNPESTAYLSGAVNGTMNGANDGKFANNVTINNCHIVGNGKEYAVYFNGENFTFTNNKVENVSRVNHYDNKLGGTHTYSGNVFTGLDREGFIFCSAVDGNMTLNINNNIFNTPTMLSINDYGELEASATSFASVNISGNTGAGVIYRLSFFKNEQATAVAGASQKVMYTMFANVNANGNNLSDYKIVSADGSLICNEEGNSEMNLASLVWISNGEYKIVEKASGNVVDTFTITNPNGAAQTINLPEVESVSTVEELIKALDNAKNDGTTTTISITSDINVDGKWEAYALPYATDNIVINGNNKTITGLTHPLFSGAFAGASVITINDLTISGAVINDKAYGNMGVGAFFASVDSIAGVILNNCHTVDSEITAVGTKDGTATEDNGYAGGLIGYSSATNVEINGCSVVRTKISGHKSAGGFVGHIQGALKVSDSKIDGCTISENLEGRTSAGAALIVGRINGGSTVTLKGTITDKDNTVNNQGGTPNNRYCSNNAVDITDATIVNE